MLFWSFAMTVLVPLCPDFDADALRGLARRSGDPDQIRRLLALADFMMRLLGMSLQRR